MNVSGNFGLPGEPASDIIYDVKIASDNTKEEINNLISHVDQVAEIHNTLRKGMGVTIRLREFN